MWLGFAADRDIDNVPACSSPADVIRTSLWLRGTWVQPLCLMGTVEIIRIDLNCSKILQYWMYFGPHCQPDNPLFIFSKLVKYSRKMNWIPNETSRLEMQLMKPWVTYMVGRTSYFNCTIKLMSLCNAMKHKNLWCKALVVHRQYISLPPTLYQKLLFEIHNYNMFKTAFNCIAVENVPI